MRGVGRLLTGAMLGAAAVTMMGMMNRSSQRKLRRFATMSSRKLANKAGELFGK